MIASPALGNIPPQQALTGQTVDISATLCYTFNQWVIYLTPDPSNTRGKIENFGRWVGYAESVGDAFTWKILTEDSRKTIYRSNIRAAELPVTQLQGEQSLSPPIIYVRGRLNDGSSSASRSMPTFDPQDLIGRTFLLDKNEDGTRFRARIKQIAYELENENSTDQMDRIQAPIHVDKGDKQVEELITYNTLLDYLEKNENEEKDPNHMWKFRAITGHQGPLAPGDHGYNHSKYNVQVEWETGETTYEPLSIIARDDPITCAIYAKKHGLLDEPGWKHLKRYVKTHKSMVRSIKQAKLRQARKATRYKCSF